jgi:hypothetical protein
MHNPADHRKLFDHLSDAYITLVSKDCADKKGTDNLSAESEVNDIDIMQQLAENEGPIAVFAYIENNLNRWTRIF